MTSELREALRALFVEAALANLGLRGATAVAAMASAERLLKATTP